MRDGCNGRVHGFDVVSPDAPGGFLFEQRASMLLVEPPEGVRPGPVNGDNHRLLGRGGAGVVVGVRGAREGKGQYDT